MSKTSFLHRMNSPGEFFKWFAPKRSQYGSSLLSKSSKCAVEKFPNISAVFCDRFNFSTPPLIVNLLNTRSYRLDIHYVLLGDMSRPHSELSAAAVQATGTLTAHQDFSKDMHIGNWPKSNDKPYEFCIWELDQWVKSDPLDRRRSKTYEELGYSKGGNFVLLKMHPVLCGMMLFRVNLNLQFLGLTLVNAWGALPITLHLYNACLSAGLLDNVW